MGLATSTYFIFMDLGVGLGPLLLGLLIPFLHFRGMYVVLGLVILVCTAPYLLWHGAEMDYKMRYPHQSDSLADHAAGNHNYNILLFMLRNGVHYDSAIKPELTIHDSMMDALELDV